MRKLLAGLALAGALMGLGVTAVGAGQARPAWNHVVAPGDTLWDLARRAAPGRDPRETVDRLIRENRLSGPTIYAGQRLILR